MAIGLFQGMEHPSNVDFLLGRSLRVTGVVASEHAIKGGISCVVQMDHVEDLEDPSSRVISTRAKASLVLFGVRGAHLAQGAQLSMQGVLERPPISDSKGLPLRDPMQKVGIRYELSGRLVSILSQNSPWTARAHARIDASVKLADPSHGSSLPLLDSIVFGQPLTNSGLRQEFLAAGLLHVLAASGANVLLVVDGFSVVVKPLFRRLRFGNALWTGLILTVIWGFCALCDDAPSIVRASLMVSYRQLGLAFGRSPDTLCATLLAYTVMCAKGADVVSTTSSVLSFVATIAVWLALRRGSGLTARSTIPSRQWVRRVLRHVVTSIRITLMVEAAMFPLSISYFGQITPYAVLSNVVAEPVLALLLPLSAAYMVLALAYPIMPFMRVACTVLGYCDAQLLRFIQRFVETVSAWKWAVIHVPPWTLGSVFAYYFVTIFTIWAWNHRKLTILWYNPIELFVINFTKSVCKGHRNNGPFKVHACNPDEPLNGKGDEDGHGQHSGSRRRVRRCHGRKTPR